MSDNPDSVSAAKRTQEWVRKNFAKQLESGEMWVCPEDDSVTDALECQAPGNYDGCAYWLAGKCALKLKED